MPVDAHSHVRLEALVTPTILHTSRRRRLGPHNSRKKRSSRLIMSCEPAWVSTPLVPVRTESQTRFKTYDGNLCEIDTCFPLL